MIVPVVAMVTAGGLMAGWAVKRYRTMKLRTLSAATSKEHAATPVTDEQSAPAPGGGGGSGGLVNDVADIGKAFANGDLLGAAVKIGEVLGNVAKDLGAGQLEQDVLKYGGVSFVAPVALSVGIDKGLEALGVENATVRKDAGQLAAVAYAFPAGLALFGTVKLGEKLFSLFSSEDPAPPIPQPQAFSRGELNQILRDPFGSLARLKGRRQLLSSGVYKKGTHMLKIRVSGDELWEEPPTFRLMVNGRTVSYDIPVVGAKPLGQWQELRHKVDLTGAQTLAFGFPNDGYSPSEGRRTLWLNWIESDDGVRYMPEEGMYYREGMEPIPGQPEMAWKGVLVWRLKPEHLNSGRPVTFPGINSFLQATNHTAFV